MQWVNAPKFKHQSPFFKTSSFHLLRKFNPISKKLASLDSSSLSWVHHCSLDILFTLYNFLKILLYKGELYIICHIVVHAIIVLGTKVLDEKLSRGVARWCYARSNKMGGLIHTSGWRLYGRDLKGSTFSIMRNLPLSFVATPPFFCCHAPFYHFYLQNFLIGFVSFQGTFQHQISQPFQE